jgi:hypothetical protein
LPPQWRGNVKRDLEAIGFRLGPMEWWTLATITSPGTRWAIRWKP